MCKRPVKRDIPQNNRENSNVNVGLLNMSSEDIGDGIRAENVIKYVIAIICIAMVFKWIRKCWTRRQQRMMNTAGQQMMAMNLIQPVQQHQQPLALPAPAPQPLALLAPAPAPAPQHVPVPIIVHHNQYKPAAIMNAGDSLERVDLIERMEKYCT